jgi:hypothetical protein
MSIIFALTYASIGPGPTNFQQTQARFERIRSSAAQRLPPTPGVAPAESGRLVAQI